MPAITKEYLDKELETLYQARLESQAQLWRVEGAIVEAEALLKFIDEQEEPPKDAQAVETDPLLTPKGENEL